MTLTPIEQKHIGDLWEWVRRGLIEIKRRSNEVACPWHPEDIYLALRTNSAALYVIGAEDGFIVVQKLESSYERVLFVWAMWGPRGTLWRHRKAIAEAIDGLAKSVGCNRVRMISSRDTAWTGVNLFVPVSTIFEREVTA